MDEEDKMIFVKAAGKGARMMMEGMDRETLFPVWQKAFHEFLKNHGCPCCKGDSSNCFLALPESLQLAVADGAGSFQDFLRALEQGIALAVAEQLTKN